MQRDAFHAIADPTRRRIIDLLATEPLNVGRVADRFPISRPAVSKQIRILSECGLVEIRQMGRERVCHARLDRLAEVADWVEKQRKIWNERYDSLDRYLLEIKAKRKYDE